jgi:peptide/nickel transport system substrate-binding protein
MRLGPSLLTEPPLADTGPAGTVGRVARTGGAASRFIRLRRTIREFAAYGWRDMRARRHPRFFSLVAVVVAVVALAGACATNDPNDGMTPAAPAPSTPRPGGRIVVGTSAEADGFLPAINRWTPASYMIARTFFDPLAVMDDTGTPRPYLAQSIEPNADFTQWTITLRDGILFHDRTPLTSEALTRHFAAAQSSQVTRAAITYFAKTTEKDRLTFVIDLKAPWAHLPALLSSQLGFIPAPSSYDPGNKDAASRPVGTGPFRFTRWDMNQKLVVDQNPTYWRKDAQGRKLPYLSQIEFRPIPDDGRRTAELRGGGLDIAHSDSYAEVAGFQKMMRDRQDGPIRAVLDQSEGAESAIVLNMQTGPFANRNLRVAAAYAIDRPGIINQMFNGFYELANGPFTSASKWGSAQNVLTYFPERAKQLVAEWKAANRNQAPVIKMTNIAVADSVPVAQRVAQAWRDVGFDVQLNNDAEATGTVGLVYGKFDAFMVRFWDRTEPDAMYHYLISDSVAAPEQLSLNFPRYSSPEVDQALKIARGSDDDAVRRTQYQRVWENYAQNLPVLWLFHTRWAVGYQERVHGIGEMTLPTGQRAEPVTWGNFFLTTVWVAA